MSIYLLLLLAVGLRTGLSASTSDQQYMHSAVLDEAGNYLLYWSFNDTSIVFEAHGKTTGWMGLGISPSGDMAGADIVIGWVNDDGQAFFKDRYATSKSKPLVDPHQDWFLLSGRKEQGYTILKFTRLLDTKDCDHDLPITMDTLRIIWAYNNALPASEDGMTYHGANTRGSKSMNLLEPAQNKDSLVPASAVRYDFLNPSVSLPSATTTYWCQVFRKPPLSVKHHLVKYGAVIQRENKGVVHHMIFYACYAPFEESMQLPSYDCLDSAMPDVKSTCQHPMALWAVGGEDFYFPPDVGFSLGGEGDPTFFLLEMHYDNPEGRSDILDSSGMSLWYTPEIRKYDAGIMDVAIVAGESMIIAPQQKSFHISSVCLPDCTQAGIPPEGIKTFAYIMHTHLAGRKVHVRQYRRGALIDELARDDNYDFNYQQMRWLKEPKTVMPGDSLVVDCFYNTVGRSLTTFGGLATTQEMCGTYIYYYPRAEMSSCQSAASPLDQFSILGIDESLVDFSDSNAPNYWANLLRDATWTPSLTNALQQKQFKSNMYYICQRKNGSAFPGVPIPLEGKYPSYIGPVKDRIQDCGTTIISAGSQLNSVALGPITLILVHMLMFLKSII